MAKRSKYDEELDGIIAQVSDAKRRAAQREGNLQRQTANLNLRLSQLEDELDIAEKVLGPERAAVCRDGAEPGKKPGSPGPKAGVAPAVAKPAAPSETARALPAAAVPVADEDAKPPSDPVKPAVAKPVTGTLPGE